MSGEEERMIRKIYYVFSYLTANTCCKRAQKVFCKL